MLEKLNLRLLMIRRCRTLLCTFFNLKEVPKKNNNNNNNYKLYWFLFLEMY
jgi:hypothetical protein